MNFEESMPCLHSIAYLEINGSLTVVFFDKFAWRKKIGSDDVIRLIHEVNHDLDCQGYLLRIQSLEGDLANIALVQEIEMSLKKGRLWVKEMCIWMVGPQCHLIIWVVLVMWLLCRHWGPFINWAFNLKC